MIVGKEVIRYKESREKLDLYELAKVRSFQIEEDFSHNGDFNRQHMRGWSENLYQGDFYRLEEIVQLWKDSPTHNEILEKDYQELVVIVRKTDDKENPYKGIYLIKK